jgi:hypothetical protein
MCWEVTPTTTALPCYVRRNWTYVSTSEANAQGMQHCDNTLVLTLKLTPLNIKDHLDLQCPTGESMYMWRQSDRTV